MQADIDVIGEVEGEQRLQRLGRGFRGRVGEGKDIAQADVARRWAFGKQVRQVRGEGRRRWVITLVRVADDDPG